MNENSGVTPNPLNPSQPAGPNPNPNPGSMPGANPSGTIPNPAQGAPAPQAPIQSPAMPGAAPQPTDPVASTFGATVAVNSLDPNGRPMEKVVPVEEPKKKSKAGLIVGLIILALALIGGGIAAVVMVMNSKKPDAVAVAMSKLMSGDAPANVAIDGSIDILINSTDSPFSRINVNLDSDIAVGSALNTSTAVLNLTTRTNNDYSVEFDEVYADGGDLYFKIDGATSLLEDSSIMKLLYGDEVVEDCETTDGNCLSLNETNCTTDATGTTNCTTLSEKATTGETTVTTTTDTTTADTTSSQTTGNALQDAIITIVKKVDGNWLKISVDEIAQYSKDTLADSPATCITSMVEDLNKNSNATAQLYNKYPFINSTTEGVVIPSKESPVYRVSVDSENFANFVNAIDNANLLSDLYDCAGWSGNVEVSTADVAKVVSTLPKVYVEVNGNQEFSRIYLETDIYDGAASVTADLSLSYPRNVNVAEPVEYTNFADVVQEVMSSMFNIDTDSQTQ